jgi:nucleotide-binding universal stress UspA family protein
MYERILVPLGGSQVAEIALDHAAEIARMAKSNLVLFHVLAPLDPADSLTGEVPNPEEGGPPSFNIDMERIEADKKFAEEYLRNLSGKVGEEQIRAMVATALGEPAEEIVSYATAADISLIVMSTHGRGGLSRPMFGSVAEKVLHNSPIPVLVIPHH